MSTYLESRFVFSTPRPSLVKRYALGWLIVGFIGCIDACWLYLSNRTVQSPGVVATCKGAGILVFIAVTLTMLRSIPRYKRATLKLRYAEAADTAAWCALLVCLVSSTCVLSYLCVSLDAPLVDSSLVRFDSTFGFDWLAVYGWVQSHDHIRRILEFAYESGRWQLMAIPLILGLSGRREALSDFFFLLVIASVILLVVSALFPATSAFIHFRISDANAAASVSDFALLRDGSLRAIDLLNAQGLVSMPSIHTALAVLFTYSLRKIPRVFGVVAALNFAMILSTPTQGGHYLADVAGGLILAVLTIQLLKVAVRQWRVLL